MSRTVQFMVAGNLLLGALFFGGCETVPQGIQQAKIEMAQRIAVEPSGDYYIGRRYYKPDFKFWGYVRRPGQPWSSAQLAMLNEKQNTVEVMHGERFPRLPFCDYETGASAFLHTIAILRLAHVLPVSCRAKRFATRSRARAPTAKDRQKTSACSHAPADSGIA